MAQPRDFGFGEEQQMLKDASRKFMEDKQPLVTLRKQIAGSEDPYLGKERTGGFDQAAWKEMVQLGWSALAVPEKDGGAGMDLVTAVAVMEEIGRSAMPTPLTSTLHATFVLREAGTVEASAWLRKIAQGKSATLAIFGADGSLGSDSTDVAADEQGLTGTSYFIQDLQKADFLVVAAVNADGVGLYCIETEGEGVTREFDRIVDLTRDQGRVSFSAAEADCVAPANLGAQALHKAMPALLTLVAADIAGGCEWLLQTTAEYARIRTQFDRPIGFFQAVKHPIVNMMIATDETRSLVYNAACAYDTDPDDADRCARLAKSSASDTAEFCANRGTQLHGGIGFTWEADVQIYHKRQIHSQYLFGDGVWHRQKLAEQL
ncbi:MAG: acyl-CoA/acyl-ACP dehydrogenase [Proteobacteria bacterium]|nr:acyl-CoA/acyl-ACP dehydrogenase [Pseudomonadota bacterium]